MHYNTDLLLDETNDLQISGGDLVTGQSWEQEIALLVPLNQGVLKSDPILGPNLITLIGSRARPSQIAERMRLHLRRDGKDYEEVKSKINVR